MRYSKNGFYLPPRGETRVLVIFAEICYMQGANDPTPPAGNPGWPAHSLPVWKDSIFDTHNVPGGSGLLTKYFKEASSGEYLLLGDYLLAPDNGGVFIISTKGKRDNNLLLQAIHEKLGSNIVTGAGFSSIDDFDKWFLNDPGLPASPPGQIRKWDHVMVIWRNSRDHNGNEMNGVGDVGANLGTLLGFSTDTYSSFAKYNYFSMHVMRHEFSHLLLGGNNFHVGGGNSGANYWIPTTGGWSMLGLYRSSIMSWNAWDRQRLDWNLPGNQYNPSVRNANGTLEMNGDLDASIASHSGIYTLRDFVSTGDALRIRLPYINPQTNFEQFIWIENHQGMAFNGSYTDRFQFENHACVDPLVPGLMMYLQIGNEVREAPSSAALFGPSYEDYLRNIPANGFFDRNFNNDTVLNSCVAWKYRYPFIREFENPLTGGGDQEDYTVDINGDDVINLKDQRGNDVELKDGVHLKKLFSLGNSSHVFTMNGNKKIGVGTNPSSASMMNMVSHEAPTNHPKDLRKIYLNGVSVEMLEQLANGDIRIKVRFDDVDVNQDVRWCADEIVLNPIQSESGFSLNVKSGKKITLDQGHTATRMTNPIVFDGEKVFASPTYFRAKSGAFINLEEGADFVISNRSTMHLETGSKLIANASSRVIVKAGSKLIVDDCAGPTH